MYKSTYCVSCVPGNEASVIATLQKKLGVKALCASWEHEEYRQGQWVTLVDPLLQGYVFLYPKEELPLAEVLRITKVTRLLTYGDGGAALRGNDLAFARWILQYEGTLGISQAMLEGDRTVILDGPLKDYEGVIKKINKQSRFALVEITVGDAVKNVWLGMRWMVKKGNDLVRWEKKNKAGQPPVA